MLAEIIGWEVLVPLVLILLLFGSAKIPQVARSLGQAAHEFKKGIGDDADADAEDSKADR